MLHSETARADDALLPAPDRKVRVPNREIFQVVVIGGHHVEQVVGAVAVEDGLAVARAFDHDRLIGRSALSQKIRSTGDRAEAAAISVAVILIYAGMNENRVARLNAGRIAVEIVGAC